MLVLSRQIIHPSTSRDYRLTESKDIHPVKHVKLSIAQVLIGGYAGAQQTENGQSWMEKSGQEVSNDLSLGKCFGVYQALREKVAFMLLCCQSVIIIKRPTLI